MDERIKELRQEIDQLFEEERVIREKRQVLQRELMTIGMGAFLESLHKFDRSTLA